MKEEILQQLIDKTFSVIACPVQANAVYAEIQKAIMAAYNLGQAREENIIQEAVVTASAA